MHAYIHTYILIRDMSWIYGQWAENFFVFGQVDVVTPFRPGAFHPSSVALPGLGCGWPGHATSKDCSDSLPSSEVKFSRRTGWSCCWYRDVSWLSWGDEGKPTNNWDYDGEITYIVTYNGNIVVQELVDRTRPYLAGKTTCLVDSPLNRLSETGIWWGYGWDSMCRCHTIMGN